MAFVVEDGTGLATATSYVSEGDADTYFDDRANTTWSESNDDKEGALVRASAAIDAMYEGRYPGRRVNGRTQGLGWPRTGSSPYVTTSSLLGLFDAAGNPIATDEIPIEIKRATFEAALRELASPGSMLPDLERGGAPLKRLKADTVELEWATSTTAQTTFSIIEGILAPLLGSSNPYSARAVRS